MQRVNGAIEKFLDEYACSQAILSQYGELFGLAKKQALQVSAGFAAGMRRGETCGAVTGAYMVLGLAFCRTECEKPSGRKNTYQAVLDFTERFEAQHGSTRCEQLLGCNVGTVEGLQKAKEQQLFQTVCPRFIKTSAELLEDILPLSDDT